MNSSLFIEHRSLMMTYQIHYCYIGFKSFRIPQDDIRGGSGLPSYYDLTFLDRALGSVRKTFGISSQIAAI